MQLCNFKVFTVVLRQASFATAFAWMVGGVSPALAEQSIISGPVGSRQFGAQVVHLDNGNFIVADPRFRVSGSQVEIGAVYLYRPNGTLVSRLTGSSDGDQVGQEQIIVLPSGNFLVRAPYWGVGNQGAVTWCSSTLGCDGAVAASNSLVGSSDSDYVGESVHVLKNGSYVVLTPRWDEAAMVNVGAVTWGSAVSGVTGVISISNSLLGSHESDNVGFGGLVPLNNGSYIVRSPYWRASTAPFRYGALTRGTGTNPLIGRVSVTNSFLGSPQTNSSKDFFGSEIIELDGGNYLVVDVGWNDGPFAAVGAVTWIAAGDSLVGSASVFNSLTGTNTNDRVGSVTIALKDGQYAVGSPNWRSGRGAVTLSAGANRIVGRVSATNSLVGSNPGDQVGVALTPLHNGNLVVSNPNWGGADGARLGSVTFLSASAPITGPVTASNSLYSVETSSYAPNFIVTPLSNGNYVVSCPACTVNARPQTGAVIFASGVSGIRGPISTANSLYGSQDGDYVGRTVLALATGNYLVLSPYVANKVFDNAGAASFGNGQTGLQGAVSPLNSLMGGAPFDQVGEFALGLQDGSYVVASPSWANGLAAHAGAVTFGSAASGVVGEVSAQNSLVGSTVDDYVSRGGVVALSSGRVAVTSSNWSRATASAVGAVTLANAATDLIGPVSAANSLIGTKTNNQLGNGQTALQLDGNVLILSPNWADVVSSRYRAVSLIQGRAGQADQVGELSVRNSVFGASSADTLSPLTLAYDATQGLLFVGQPGQNRVVLFRADALFSNGFEP